MESDSKMDSRKEYGGVKRGLYMESPLTLLLDEQEYSTSRGLSLLRHLLDLRGKCWISDVNPYWGYRHESCSNRMSTHSPGTLAFHHSSHFCLPHDPAKEFEGIVIAWIYHRWILSRIIVIMTLVNYEGLCK